jgi:hypothetical protein
MMNLADTGLTFVHGEIVPTGKAANPAVFLPGVRSSDARFVCGVVGETAAGPEFVEGKLVKAGAEALFVPGTISGPEDRFEKAANQNEVKR